MTTPLRRAPLVQEVAAALIDQIGSGAIGADGWLPPERSLAAALGVSRNVLREAIRQLQSQGMLESRHGVGVRVVKIPYKPIADAIAHAVPALAERLLELTQIRLMIEPEVARLAARNPSAELIADLTAAQEGLAGSSDAAQAAEFDLTFHRRLAVAANNRTLLLLLNSLAEVGRESRQVTLDKFGIQSAYAQHQEILAHVQAGNPDAAALAMRVNLEATERDVGRLREEKL
ncbi:MAG: FCD domain-containing protein [Capsulimonadaceae bacterium]|nr:FCD domain-containing protein [Capsulimonadaceae bacterium]